MKDHVAPAITLAMEKLDEEFKKREEERDKKYIEHLEKFIGEMQDEKNKKPKVIADPDDGEDPKCGFKHFPEFARAVYLADPNVGGKVDPRLLAIKEREEQIMKAAGDGQTVAVDSEGGFLVPTAFRPQLLEGALEQSNFINLCTPIPMSTDSVKVPYIDGFDHSSYVHGAVKVYWPNEEGSITSSKVKFGVIQLNLHPMAALVYATDQILRFSPISMQPLLTTKFQEAFGFEMDRVILEGTGVGQPQGILNCNAIVSIGKETNQTAATIVLDNVIKMYARMPSQSRGSAVWVLNNDCLPQILKLSLAVGTGGSAVYLPVGGLSVNPFENIMGKEAYYTEHCKTLGTTGDIYFADFKQYLVGQLQGQGLDVASSIHLKFDYAQTAFRFLWYVDGQSWWPTYLTPEEGTNYLSPFIKLDTRD